MFSVEYAMRFANRSHTSMEALKYLSTIWSFFNKLD
ncbi:hypothetical protein SAMN05443247_04866 [Bradyrhizobium erythrophlei]|jgi:hypothetical protein|nr:hypothetical protein SAMN05443247_04866 [Bradyrhizobium erythrophlei]